MSKILDELESKAKAAAAIDCPWSATGGWLEEGGKACFLREHALGEDDVSGDVDPTDEEEHRAETDAEFSSAANPQTVLALVEVVRAASRLREGLVIHGLMLAAVPDFDAAMAKLEGLVKP